MRVLDLFAGIGGFSLGLHMAGGFETVGFVERDEKCQAVLRKNFPGVPIFGDIKEFGGDECGPVDVICGGFPCQPFSHAGKRRGAEDDRHLWPEMLRVIQRARPTWVIGENVAGIIRMELDTVLSDLEASGYACQPLVIPACAVDAPHRRDRVWILCHSHSHSQPACAVNDEAQGVPSDSLGNTSSCGRNVTPNARPESNWQSQRTAGGSSSNASDADSVHAQGQQSRISDEKERAKQGERSARSQDASAGRIWMPEPAVGRVAPRLPGGVDRLKQLGNSVVPHVVAEFGRAIKYQHRNKGA